MNIITSVESLAKYLKDKFTEDKFALQYKSTTVPNEFETSVPEVYCFTMPSSSLIDSYPAKCPSICITLDGRDGAYYNVSIHLCISNASVNDKEVAYPTPGISNVYKLGTSDEYTTEADSDLIMESILFTDQVYNYIMNYTEADVSEVNVEYPSVDLPDFPYAVSSVSLRLSVNKDKVGQNPYHEFY